jgi:virulence-associated protein VagC
MLETAKIVWIDGEQVVLFPDGFKLPFDEVTFRREGLSIVLEPTDARNRETINSQDE